MTVNKNIFNAYILFCVVACTKPKLTIMEKYQKAVKYYNKGDYSDAIELFKEILLPLTGKIEGINSLYYLGQSFFSKKDYALALNSFEKFFDSYPQDERVEEVLYLQIMCLYNQSRYSNLEQSATYGALDSIYQYINLYPQGVFVDIVNLYKVELENKLQEKLFNQMKVFYDMGYYKSSAHYCKNILKEYPETYYIKDVLKCLIYSLYKIVKDFNVVDINNWNGEEKQFWISFYRYYIIAEERNLLDGVETKIKNFFRINFNHD